MPIFKTKNEDFFKAWSREMAYVLGYFAADGYMSVGKRGNFYVGFDSVDRELIELVKKCFQTDLKISERKRNKKWRNIFGIQIGSKEIFLDLAALGMRPNKSKIMEFPYVPQQFLGDFVRGYFDGDGCVSGGIYRRSQYRPNPFVHILNANFTSGSKKFLASLHMLLRERANISGGTLYCTDVHRLAYSLKDGEKLYTFMYHTVPKDLYLRRKKINFERLLGLEA